MRDLPAFILVAVFALSTAAGRGVSAFDWQNSSATDIYAETTRLPLVSVGDCGCIDGCGAEDFCASSCGGWIVDADLLLLQYGSALALNGSLFNYEPSIRMVLGYQNDNGFGVRLRWWDFDHSAALVPGATVRADTFNIDLEAFQRLYFGELTSVDLSAGVRYNDFRETLTAPPFSDFTSFTGFGGIVGVKARRQLFNGAAYANANMAIFLDDLTASGIVLSNSMVSQTEIGAGYEFWRYNGRGAKLWLRGGYEWWLWNGYVPGFNIGFAGFVLGGGAQF